ncbi:MAG: hypothetical protein RL154_967 [Pseudomonadota bacterium]|jgi:hypothetical protein
MLQQSCLCLARDKSPAGFKLIKQHSKAGLCLARDKSPAPPKDTKNLFFEIYMVLLQMRLDYENKKYWRCSSPK